MKRWRVSMNKKWQYYNQANQAEEQIKEIIEKFKINRLLATILINRNITNEEDIKIFLEPTRKDFHDPYLLPDLEI